MTCDTDCKHNYNAILTSSPDVQYGILQQSGVGLGRVPHCGCMCSACVGSSISFNLPCRCPAQVLNVKVGIRVSDAEAALLAQKFHHEDLTEASA